MPDLRYCLFIFYNFLATEDSSTLTNALCVFT